MIAPTQIVQWVRFGVLEVEDTAAIDGVRHRVVRVAFVQPRLSPSGMGDYHCIVESVAAE